MAVPVVITDYHPDQILTAGELNFDFARAIDISAVGLAGGVAPLGLDGKVPTTMLPPAATGLSITSTAINGSGHLIITYSNATTQDAGLVKGADGATGATGVSIVTAAVNGSGHLILTKSDSTTVDAGAVQGTAGPPGRSVSSATVNGSGHLIITFSDSATQDAGAVVGPPGTAPATDTVGALPAAAALSDTDLVPIVQPSQTSGAAMVKMTLAQLKAYVIAGISAGSTPPPTTTAPALPTLTGLSLLARYSAKDPGTTATQWKDVGGNNWTLTRVSSNPAMTVDASNRPVCRFNGTTDTWSMPLTLVNALIGPRSQSGDRPITIFLVPSVTVVPTTGTQRSLSSVGDTAATNYWFATQTAAAGWTNTASSNFGGASNSDNVAQNTAAATGKVSYLATKDIFSNSGFTDVFGRLWINGTSLATRTHSGIVQHPTYNVGYIGSDYIANTGAPQNFFSGDLYEAIYFVGTPTTADISALRSWATTNFGAP
jgi:hypothetical protein